MIVIYTDGAVKTFTKGKEKRIKQAWAFVAVDDRKKGKWSVIKELNGLVIRSERKSSKNKSVNAIKKSRNIAAEVEAVMQALKWATSKKKIKRVLIVSDYRSCVEWPLGIWKAHTSVALRYVHFVKKMNKKLEIGFYWVKGHSGNKWNDYADKLAKEALVDEKSV